MCPGRFINLYNKVGEKTTPLLYRWEDCATECRKRVGCRYWTWHHENSGPLAFKCVTMTDATSDFFDRTAISGSRYCGTVNSYPNGPLLHQCPSRKLQIDWKWKNHKKMVGEKWQNFVSSARDCAKMCKDRWDCRYWTWYHSGEYAFWCLTVANGGMKRERNGNSLTGDRYCPSTTVIYYIVIEGIIS